VPDDGIQREFLRLITDIYCYYDGSESFPTPQRVPGTGVAEPPPGRPLERAEASTPKDSEQVTEIPYEFEEPQTPIRSHAECPVCLNAYLDPRLLSCGHTLCRTCVCRLLDAGRVVCPMCRQTTQCEGLDSLKTNFALLSIIDEGQTAAVASTTASASAFVAPLVEHREKCSGCAKPREDFWYCGQCEVKVCSSCLLKLHRTHQGHEAFDELRVRWQKDVEVKAMSYARLADDKLATLQAAKQALDKVMARVNEKMTAQHGAVGQLIAGFQSRLEAIRASAQSDEALAKSVKSMEDFQVSSDNILRSISTGLASYESDLKALSLAIQPSEL
jgi:zinc-RING finger domain